MPVRLMCPTYALGAAAMAASPSAASKPASTAASIAASDAASEGTTGGGAAWLLVHPAHVKSGAAGNARPSAWEPVRMSC